MNPSEREDAGTSLQPTGGDNGLLPKSRTALAGVLRFGKRHRRLFVGGSLAAIVVVAARLALPWPLRAIAEIRCNDAAIRAVPVRDRTPGALRLRGPFAVQPLLDSHDAGPAASRIQRNARGRRRQSQVGRRRSRVPTDRRCSSYQGGHAGIPVARGDKRTAVRRRRRYPFHSRPTHGVVVRRGRPGHGRNHDLGRGHHLCQVAGAPAQGRSARQPHSQQSPQSRRAFETQANQQEQWPVRGITDARPGSRDVGRAYYFRPGSHRLPLDRRARRRRRVARPGRGLTVHAVRADAARSGRQTLPPGNPHRQNTRSRLSTRTDARRLACLKKCRTRPAPEKPQEVDRAKGSSIVRG